MDVWLPFISALLGVVVGALAALLTDRQREQWAKDRAHSDRLRETRRDLLLDLKDVTEDVVKETAQLSLAIEESEHLRDFSERAIKTTEAIMVSAAAEKRNQELIDGLAILRIHNQMKDEAGRRARESNHRLNIGYARAPALIERIADPELGVAFTNFLDKVNADDGDPQSPEVVSATIALEIRIGRLLAELV